MKLYILAMLLLGSDPVLAHGGGLNSEGCHNNRKTGDYHCHRGGGSDSSLAPDPERATRQRAAQQEQQSPPPCYTGPRGGTYTITKSGRKNYSGC